MPEDNETINQGNESEIAGELLEIYKEVIFGDGVTAEDLASKFNISKPKAQYYLDELEEMNYVHSEFALSGPPYYYGTKEGRKYGFEKGLL